jgi:hypothetical protein
MADEPAPRRTPLLERPDLAPRDRVRIGGAVAAFLAAGLVAVAALGALAIWHLVRRGRLIRERLGNPRDVRLPDVEPRPDSRPDGPLP